MNTAFQRLTSFVLALLVAIICLALPADTTKLTQAQWRHALAIIAQNEALDLGFGQATKQFVDATQDGIYSLDDLNATYGQNSKWSEVYHRLKNRENEEGTIADIKKEAGRLSPQVSKDLSDFLASATKAEESAVDVPLAPLDEPVSVPDEPEPPKKPSGTMPLTTALLALLALLGIGTGVAAFVHGKKVERNLQNELDITNRTHEKFANDIVAQYETLMQRVSNLEDNKHVMNVRQIQSRELRVAQQAPSAQKQEKTLYLSRPDENDCFTRVSEDFEPGNSLFVLTTADGRVGEYQVINNPNVHRFALMMPTENLTQACSGNSIQVSAGMSRIVTDRPGEAHYDNGRWRVVIKAIIHYES